MPPLATTLDGSQVLQHSFEESTGRIRVDTGATIIGGDLEVAIDHTEDSIRLGDGTSFFTSTSGGGKVGLDVNVLEANTPQIFNVSIPLANTEVSQALPTGTKYFLIRVRGSSSLLKLAFSAGTSGTTFVEVNRGTVYSSPVVTAGSVTLYFQTTQASQTAEILVWKLV